MCYLARKRQTILFKAEINMKKRKLPRCGHEFLGRIEIPIGVEIKTAPSGRPYYISGQTAETTIIRYTDDGTFKEVETKTLN